MKIILVLFFILLLVSCSDNNLKEQKNIIENNNKCLNLNNEIEEREGKLFHDCGSVEIIKSFYSYNLNSCIYLVQSTLLDCTTLKNNFGEYNYKLMSYSNNKLILSKKCNIDENQDICLKQINDKIIFLKK